MADRTGKNNEIKIHHHLASRSGTHPGSAHVITILDHFQIQGPNGEHDVVVSQIVGPHLEAMSYDDAVKEDRGSLVYQVMVGTSSLHHPGVAHGGSVNSHANRSTTHGCDLDLHWGNIAFEVSDFDGMPEKNVIRTLGTPFCEPLITEDHRRQTESLPKYVVIAAKLEDHVKRDPLRLKIIDLGEGSLRLPHTWHRGINTLQPS